MIRIYVRHKVRSYGKWRRVYDAFDKIRRPMGVRRHAVYQSVRNPKDVTVSHDFSTLEKARAFTRSPKLRQAMKKAGVRGKPDIWFVTEAGKTKRGAKRKVRRRRRARRRSRAGAGRR